MKHNQQWTLFPRIALVFVASLLLSCVNDDNEDCGIVNVGFSYSYNILSSNALAAQADQVTLCVFDPNGLLVLKESNDATSLTNDFSIRVQKLETGRHIFAAWAQSTSTRADESMPTIPDLIVGQTRLTDLTYYLKRTAGVLNTELGNILVGYTQVDVNRTGQTQNIKLDLKKINKKVRVVLLPYTGGSELDVNNYEFSIVDPIGNGYINYDFSLLRDEPLTYLPYYTANILPQEGESLSPTQIDRAAVVEISTSRLMVGNNPKLVIKSKESGQEVVSINLPWFFSLTEMESHREWSIQEYMDRQDSYAVTMFINGDTWMNGTIIINGWVVNNIVFGK